MLLSTTSYTRWWSPLSEISPIYIDGRLRTASRPSRTWILLAEYCSSACFISSFSIISQLLYCVSVKFYKFTKICPISQIEAHAHRRIRTLLSIARASLDGHPEKIAKAKPGTEARIEFILRTEAEV